MEIYGKEVKVETGSVIRLDTGRVEKLFPCDDWDRANFRYPNPIQGWEESHAIACNVTVTGRTEQRYGGERWVRVSIEWVQDDDPSTFSSGWLLN